MDRACVGCAVVNDTGGTLGAVPGRPESPVMICATKESFASANAGASGMGGAPVMAVSERVLVAGQEHDIYVQHISIIELREGENGKSSIRFHMLNAPSNWDETTARTQAAGHCLRHAGLEIRDPVALSRIPSYRGTGAGLFEPE